MGKVYHDKQDSSDCGILLLVHKPFYASGFLYHLKTQQILLHQSNLGSVSLPTWSMCGGESHDGEDAECAFQRIMQEQVNLRLMAKHLFPVYDYFYNALNKVHFVFYAEVQKLYTFPQLSTGAFSWFTFKQTTKLAFSPQAKQDIIISERVIKAQARSLEPHELITPPKQHSGLYH